MQNYYEILDVSSESTTEEITKAYKKKALIYHPDKKSDLTNPDLFIQLKDAYDTLIDPIKRKAYDDKLLHPKRKTIEESLSEELREELSKQEKAPIKKQKQFLSEIIEQTTEIGHKKADLELQMKNPEIIKLRIAWNSKKGDYSEEKLTEIFRMFGEIHKIELLSKNEASLSYKHVSSAEIALTQQNTLGNPANKLKISWYNGEPKGLSKYKELTGAQSTKMSKKQYEDFEQSVLMKFGIIK